MKIAVTLLLALWSVGMRAADATWTPDLGNGRFRNPVLFLDYSDPDVIRVGPDYYLVASSFSCVPGLPILHSTDLVNWEFEAYALPRLEPEDYFSTPRHGEGVWAPSLRFHAGTFYIYYPDPDRGIYVVTATNPKGPWSPPHLVQGGKGRIDPCPLWDDDGKVYLVHAWAHSRGPVSNRLSVETLAPDGRSVTGPEVDVVDGAALDGWTVIEGPKFYKRNGYYYLFAPAGGVPTGYQGVFRSRSVLGPYENRIVLVKGKTPINGPHQGAWVDTVQGEDWFLHFQDRGAFGRVVHLEPMRWRSDDWPVMGSDPADTGQGVPVSTADKPRTERPSAVMTLPTSDEFNSALLGPQWQWQANPKADFYSLTAKPGFLRLTAVASDQASLWNTPQLLLQKFPGPSFSATTTVDLSGGREGDRAGLVVFGNDYGWVGLQKTPDGCRVSFGLNRGAVNGKTEIVQSVPVSSSSVTLRVSVEANSIVRFSWSETGEEFSSIGEAFRAQPDKWVGSKVGLFADGKAQAGDPGHADFDWFRVGPMIR